MRTLSFTTLLAIATLAVSPHATRAIMFSLSSSPSDLTTLSVGDTVTLDVSLSGLAPGEELAFLAATIGFDDNVFGAPLAVDPGIDPPGILPDPLGFDGTRSPGLADGLFDAFNTASGNDRITTNGLFYTFRLEVQPSAVVGPGQIAFGFVDALLPDFSAPMITTSDPLSLTVVPEPTAALMLGFTAALFVTTRRRNRPASLRKTPRAPHLNPRTGTERVHLLDLSSCFENNT